MVLLENNRYDRTERYDSPSYWLSRLVLTSASQKLSEMTDPVMAGSIGSMVPEIRSFGTERDTGFLAVGINLEADGETQAMAQLSLMSLTAMRRAGVEVEDLTLVQGRLASGYDLDRIGCGDEALLDPRFALDHDLEDIFTGLQDMLTNYDLNPN